MELTNILWVMRNTFIAFLIIGPIGIGLSYKVLASRSGGNKWLIKACQNVNSLFSGVFSTCCLWAWLIVNSEGAKVCG